MATPRYAFAPTWLTDSHGHPYQAWEVRVPGMLLIFTTAELDRAQKRGKAQETRQRVAAQSVEREVAGFTAQYPIA